jgi:hypothetical protein
VVVMGEKGRKIQGVEGRVFLPFLLFTFLQSCSFENYELLLPRLSQFPSGCRAGFRRR